MSERFLIAVPSDGNGGLQADRAGHFGHCDCFTLVDVCDGAVDSVRIVRNLPHVEGGCLRPVQMLADEGVNAIIVAGIGGRPLAGFTQAGISVYHDAELPEVGAVVDALIAGNVALIDPGNACGHHH